MTEQLDLLWGTRGHKRWTLVLAPALILVAILFVVQNRVNDGGWFQFNSLLCSTHYEGIPFILLFLAVATFFASMTCGSSRLDQYKSSTRMVLAWTTASFGAAAVLVAAFVPLVWAFAYTPLHEGDVLPGPNSILGALGVAAFGCIATARAILRAWQSR